MSDVAQLREQLSGLGFSLLDNEGHNSAGVLEVEVWIRYTPHSIIPLPVRGAAESDESFNARLDNAAALVAEASEVPEQAEEYSQEESVEKPRISSMSEVDRIANSVQEEGFTDDVGLPSGSEYYQYSAPVVEVIEPEPTVEIDTTPEFDEIISQPEAETLPEPAPAVLTESAIDREALIRVRHELQTAIDNIDAILAPR